MGKPYQSELNLIPATIEWALKQDISTLRHSLLHELGPHNLIAIGSGGSLVAAEFAALLHETATGHLARSASPLEATVRQTPRNTAALLLSASGSNADILQAAELLPGLGYETHGSALYPRGISAEFRSFGSRRIGARVRLTKWA